MEFENEDLRILIVDDVPENLDVLSRSLEANNYHVQVATNGEPLPQESEATGPLEGNAGSPGKIRGPAKVIRSLAEASKLQPGDILVAPTTSPPWTPLFATAGGIVTDTGGVLSHCAVVAREYRIPAVVGTGSATFRIEDGQILEVDGDAGIVHIIVETE